MSNIQLGLFTSVNESVIYEGARNNFKKSFRKIKIVDKLNCIMTESGNISKFLKDEDFKINVYLFNGNSYMGENSSINTYNTFIDNINEIEQTVRESLLKHYNENRSLLLNKLKTKYNESTYYYKMVSSHKFNTDSIDEIYTLGWISIGDGGEGNLDLYIGGVCEDVLMIPVIRDGQLYNTSEVNALREAATFKNLEVHEDLTLIATKGRVKNFLGEKNLDFIIWLKNTYEVQEIQKERYREFQMNTEFFDNLVSEALITYYKCKYPQIKRTWSKASNKGYTMYDIDIPTIKSLCKLSRLDIDRSGSMYVSIKTEWGEYISIQLYKVSVQLTNTFALPMCGSKFGYIDK